MNIWYLSYNRFEKRIINEWNRKGIKYNSGNINILKYAYKTLLIYSTDKKISNKNFNEAVKNYNFELNFTKN